MTAEQGWHSLIIEIILNAVKYWFRMKNVKQDTLLYDCYQANIEIARSGNKCLLSTIEKIANLSNFQSELDNEKHAFNKVAVFLKNTFDQQFEKDMFNDERSNDGGNKLRTFKNDIKRELYLTEIKDTITRKKYHQIKNQCT